MFDVDVEGDSARNEKLNELADINIEMRALKGKEDEGSRSRLQELWKQYQAIAAKLDWKTDAR